MTPSFALANDQICFNTTETAKQALTDLTFNKEQFSFLSNKLSICAEDRSILQEQKKVLVEENTALKIDVSTLKEVSEQYKEQFIATNESLQKEKQSKPSRLKWFALGVISTLIASIAVLAN